jgi:hypothetical protein
MTRPDAVNHTVHSPLSDQILHQHALDMRVTEDCARGHIGLHIDLSNLEYCAPSRVMPTGTLVCRLSSHGNAGLLGQPRSRERDREH